MTRKVYDDIFKIDVALPNNPLKSLNVYVIRGEEKSLVIDTGFNQKECIDDLFRGLEELNIDIGDTELFITHLHSDHSGMAHIFHEAGARIYAGEIDGRLINYMASESHWARYEEEIISFDLARDKVTISEHPGFKYRLRQAVDFTYVKEGKGIQVGKYFFEVIDIHGHTPGQVGLYERNHKLFFAGDHVLDSITPNIAYWGGDENILAVYLNNLAKIYSFEIDYLFPAHRNIIRDHTRRINELVLHHRERLDEILQILGEGESTVRDLARKMKWSIRAKDWNDFPLAQKWFAASEAMAHLEHLYHSGLVERNLIHEKLYFNLK
ncbi:MAG: MBL fold metallo-hydrolase [Tissierellaceae bacterium]